MLLSRCASYVFSMTWWCTSLHIPHTPSIYYVYLRLLVASVAGCPGARCHLVDPACITIRDYVLHCAGLHIRHARVTVSSQVLHKSKPSKFSCIVLWLGSLRLQAEATPMQVLCSYIFCSQLQEPCTRAIQHNVVVLSIVSYISTD